MAGGAAVGRCGRCVCGYGDGACGGLGAHGGGGYGLPAAKAEAAVTFDRFIKRSVCCTSEDSR